MIAINNVQNTSNITGSRQSVTVEAKQQETLKIDLTISSGSNPLELAYKSMLDRINEELEPYLGDQAIQRGYESGLDVSPEATADRIVGLSTALFAIYNDQHPNVSDEEAAQDFAKIISGGVEQGFADAKEILSGLGVLEGEIESNINKTFDLVIQGIADFVNSYARE